MVYYIKTSSIDRLGFPRLENGIKKKYVWKRMNFVTSLPKNDPLIYYVVASSFYEDLTYRMHIAWKKNSKQNPNEQDLAICQILRIPEKTKNPITNKNVNNIDIKSMTNQFSECLANPFDLDSKNREHRGGLDLNYVNLRKSACKASNAENDMCDETLLKKRFFRKEVFEDMKKEKKKNF